MKKVGITIGDINGISPEIIIKALNELDLPKNKVVIFGSKTIFDFYAKKFNLKLKNDYEIVEISLKEKDICIGKPSKISGEIAFLALSKALEYAKDGKITSIMTAPLAKNAIHMAGYNFSGHTEILEHFLARENQKAEMLFVADKIRVLLLTRHIALRDVPEVITKDLIIEKIKRLNYFLKNKCLIENPKIAVCGLNPHASEDGLFGDEEIKIINPAIKELQNMGIKAEGAFPADGLFANIKKKIDYDCYVAMYHDQGLVGLKLYCGENTVNTTIGLDVIRTSPAHGCAFDIAGKNIADYTSTKQAIISALNY